VDVLHRAALYRHSQRSGSSTTPKPWRASRRMTWPG
jgi:hypothetical protein